MYPYPHSGYGYGGQVGQKPHAMGGVPKENARYESGMTLPGMRVIK